MEKHGFKVNKREKPAHPSLFKANEWESFIVEQSFSHVVVLSHFASVNHTLNIINHLIVNRESHFTSPKIQLVSITAFCSRDTYRLILHPIIRTGYGHISGAECITYL